MNDTLLLKRFHPCKVSDLKRLGNKYDGGYIIHSPSLKDADYLITYGIGYDVSFEKAFFNETAKPTLAFDPTLRRWKSVFNHLIKGRLRAALRDAKNQLLWLATVKTFPKYQIKFIQEGIAAKNSSQYKTFQYHFDKYQLKGKKIIFKIDVDGAEYNVFSDPEIYPLLENAIQIYIEFHALENNLEQVSEIINKLQKTHALIHIHANNYADVFDYDGQQVPKYIEVSFLLNSYVHIQELSDLTYPIDGLDFPCDRRAKDIPLNFFY